MIGRIRFTGSDGTSRIAVLGDALTWSCTDPLALALLESCCDARPGRFATVGTPGYAAFARAQVVLGGAIEVEVSPPTPADHPGRIY